MILLVVAFLWFVRDIVVIVLFAMILSSAIDPMVDLMQRARIPRAVSVLLLYLLIVVVVLGTITLLVPAFAQQVLSDSAAPAVLPRTPPELAAAGPARAAL
ncbi:MAG: AI-2E family transporter [Candidatus Andersenbacteria bacterium]